MLVSAAIVASAVAQPPPRRPPPPAELVELTIKARLSGTILSFCAAEFTPGRKGAFAVAAQSPDGNRRYMALDADGTMMELMWFNGPEDLRCYTRAEAEKLDESLKQSDIIHGSVRPRFDSTVVCGFVEDTSAVCWQYSPAERDFVVVGKWMT
jgi:hypothetical protein